MFQVGFYAKLCKKLKGEGGLEGLQRRERTREFTCLIITNARRWRKAFIMPAEEAHEPRTTTTTTTAHAHKIFKCICTSLVRVLA